MSSLHRFTIVVGIDYSELSDRALDQALEIASLRDGSEVHVLYVEPDAWTGTALGAVPNPSPTAEIGIGKVRELASARVLAMPDILDRTRIRRVVAHYRRGSPAENIAQLAADLDADLVVVGSHGHRGWQRLLLGSVAERAARLCRCPVWIVRPKAHAVSDRVPEIEPPCPECVKTREETGGKQLWCARHAEHHIRAHAFSYSGDDMYAPESKPYASTPQR